MILGTVQKQNQNHKKTKGGLTLANSSLQKYIGKSGNELFHLIMLVGRGLQLYYIASRLNISVRFRWKTFVKIQYIVKMPKRFIPNIGKSR